MWDERYASAEYVYGTEPNDFLREAVGQLPVGDVLCLADGEGRNGVWLAGQGFRVTSVDASMVGLGKTRALAESRGVSLTTVHADLAEFDLGAGRWDAVVSIFCHLPPPLRRDVHARVVAALKPGGVLLLEAYHPEQLNFATGGPPVADLMMRLADLRAELPGLEVLHAVETERDVIEGAGHWGRGAVVQFIARKP
ncbi:MAG: class I SAM-dependent methyltransferase [Gammaproteobacteria bacterium]|nr:class I SAM-dependent methyltransferase [Gammaproteobacteria bacterium]